jgi:hypothetical protein
MKLTTSDKSKFDLFLERRVAKWRAGGAESSGLLLPTFLGMSVEEYGDWHLGRLDDHSYVRLIRFWN